MSMKDRILELLSKQVHLFISDLRVCRDSEPVRRALRDFPWTDYPLDEDSYVLSYLYDQPLSFDSYDGLHDYLSQNL